MSLSSSLSTLPQSFSPAIAIGSAARDLLDQLHCGRSLDSDDATALLRQVLGFAIEADQRLVSAHVRLQSLENDSMVDPLTGLLSEAGLKANFTRCSAAASRYGEPGLMLVIEIANLEDLRLTTLRAGAMETYQRALATGLMKQIRTCDTAGRLTNSTFIALLERCPSSVADKKGRAVAKAMAAISVVHGDRRLESPMRVGWAPFGAGSTLQGTIAAARHCLSNQTFNVEGLN
jgi:GGDEF domain-containing protein